jgi:hypothetical protein
MDGLIWEVGKAEVFVFEKPVGGLTYTTTGETDDQGRQIYVWDGP